MEDRRVAAGAGRWSLLEDVAGKREDGGKGMIYFAILHTRTVAGGVWISEPPAVGRRCDPEPYVS